jgi:hypothetical protein
MEPEGSLSRSQKPVSGFCMESNPVSIPAAYFCKVRFKCLKPSGNSMYQLL